MTPSIVKESSVGPQALPIIIVLIIVAVGAMILQDLEEETVNGEKEVRNECINYFENDDFEVIEINYSGSEQKWICKKSNKYFMPEQLSYAAN